MADEAENLVLQLLREIRAKQDDHSRLLADHAKQLGEIRETSLLAVGIATMANYKLDHRARGRS